MADDLVTALLAAGRRPKFHELLAQGAASTAPTPSWGAALARALQGGMAGLLERGDENSNVAEFDRLNPQASAQQASAPQSAPLTTLVGNNPAAFAPQSAPPVEPQPRGTTMLPVAGTEDTVPLPKRNPLGALNPEFRSKFADLRTAAGDRGAYFDAPEQGSIGNVRSPQQQLALYAQGRSAPGPVVTGTTQSNHMTGRALDVVPTNGASEKQIGSVVSALAANDPRFAGMRSGATFSNLYDPLHVELNKPQGPTQVASLDPNAGAPQQPPSLAMALQQPAQGQSPPVPQPMQPPQPPPQQMAQAAPQMAQPQARVAPQIPPEVMARAREAARRDGPAAGEAVLAPYRKPADQWEVVPSPVPGDNNKYQQNSATKELKPLNPQPFAVNLNSQNQTEFEKDYGQGMSKRALAVIDAGDKGSEQVQRVQILRSLNKAVETGALTGVQSTMGGVMQAIGVDPKAVGIDPNLPANVQTMRALSNEMVVGKLGAGGFPSQNFSNTDRTFLEKTVPSYTDRPEANEMKLAVAERVAQLQMERADKWSEARANGKSYEAFEREWRKDLQGRDVFGDIAKNIQATEGSVTGRANATAATGGGAGKTKSGIEWKIK